MHENGIEEDDLAALAQSLKRKQREDEKTLGENKYQINHFGYKRRKPFHPQRLLELLSHLPTEIIRYFAFETVFSLGAACNVMFFSFSSKGFIWIATRHDSCIVWAHAGYRIRLHDGGLFWAARPESARGTSDIFR